MLQADSAALIVIDVQEKLAEQMHDKAALLGNLAILTRGAGVLGMPILHTEQNPSRLGPTLPPVAEHLPGEPIAKMAFNCCGERGFMDALDALGRRQVLLCGIEAHICVYQTAAALLQLGYEVHVPADAVSSRTAANRQIGLERMRNLGAAVVSVEMVLFEMLSSADDERFKDILKIVK